MPTPSLQPSPQPSLQPSPLTTPLPPVAQPPQVLLLERDSLPMEDISPAPGAAAEEHGSSNGAPGAGAGLAGGALRGAADAVASKRRGVPQFLQPHVRLDVARQRG